VSTAIPLLVPVFGGLSALIVRWRRG